MIAVNAGVFSVAQATQLVAETRNDAVRVCFRTVMGAGGNSELLRSLTM